MKRYSAILLLLLLSATAWSQDSLNTARPSGGAYKRGNYVATLSVGFMNGYKSDYKVPATFETGNITGFAPLYAKLEYGLTDRISLAVTSSYNVLYFNSFHLYTGYSGPIRRYTNDQFRFFSGGVTGFYHLGHLFHIDRLDPFVGVGVSLNNIRHTALPEGDSTVLTKSHTVMPYLKVGARYYVSDKVAVFADAGFDKLSVVSLGFSCRFFKATSKK